MGGGGRSNFLCQLWDLPSEENASPQSAVQLKNMVRRVKHGGKTLDKIPFLKASRLGAVRVPWFHNCNVLDKE